MEKQYPPRAPTPIEAPLLSPNGHPLPPRPMGPPMVSPLGQEDLIVRCPQDPHFRSPALDEAVLEAQQAR